MLNILYVKFNIDISTFAFQNASNLESQFFRLSVVTWWLIGVFLTQEEVSESDVDPHFKQLFKQIAGNVGRGTWELTVKEMC